MTANNTTAGETASSAAQTIALTVNPAAETPVLTLGSTTATVTEGNTVTLPSITASGVDGDDTLTVTIAGLAAGATITNSADSTVFSGSSFTLTGAEVGSTLTLHDGSNEGNFTLTVTANNTTAGETASSAAQTIALTVNPAAETPVLTLGSTTATVTEGNTVTLPSITASGVDGDDTLTVTIAGLAAGATITNSADSTVFSGSSFTLSGAEVGSTLTLHDGSNEGNFTLTVTANNTTAGETASSAAQTIALTVNPAAEGPVFGGTTSATVSVGGVVTLAATDNVFDSDDTLGNVTITGLPGDLTNFSSGTYTAGTGTWTGTAAQFDALTFTAGAQGTFNLTISATTTGAEASTSTEGYTLTVNSVFSVTASVVGNLPVQEGQTLVGTATGADAGATINYQWQSSSDGGVTWTNVSGGLAGNFANGQPSSFLQLTDSGEGLQFRVQASFTNTNDQLISATSATTAAVADVTPVITAPFAYAVEGLSVVKNGTEVYNDTFSQAPPASPTILSNGVPTPIVFLTLGSTWTEFRRSGDHVVYRRCAQSGSFWKLRGFCLPEYQHRSHQHQWSQGRRCLHG